MKTANGGFKKLAVNQFSARLVQGYWVFEVSEKYGFSHRTRYAGGNDMYFIGREIMLGIRPMGEVLEQYTVHCHPLETASGR